MSAVVVVDRGGPTPFVVIAGGDGGPAAVYGGGSQGPKPFFFSGAPLQSRLSIKIHRGESVSLQAGKLPVELTFSNKIDIVQRFTNAEYVFIVLDAKGELVEGALIFTTEVRDIVLSGRSTIDRPNVFLNGSAFNVGQTYQLFCLVRNLAAACHFKVDK
jgi:hypothetical protein